MKTLRHLNMFLIGFLLGILLLVGLLSVAKAQGYSEWSDKVSKEEYCAHWAGNAATGGVAALRGMPFVIYPVDRANIMEIIEHLDKIEGIAVFREDMADPKDARFIMDGLQYGYDYVKRTDPNKLPSSAQEAMQRFWDVCMAREDV